jgi:Skp family chaperone for outer membrane proteins
MKLGLEDELARHQVKINQIETDLKKIKNQIDENTSKGFLGIGNKTEAQKAALLSYCKKVELTSATPTEPTLGSLKLEVARKDEAIAIYDEMINIIESFYKEEEIETGTDKKRLQITGSSLDVLQMYDALRGLVDSENDSYKPSKAAKNETIFADAYFKDYYESHNTEAFELSEQAIEDLEGYISKIFVDQPKADNDLLAALREYLLGLLPEDVKIKKIQQNLLSLDELFIDCFGVAGDIADDHDQVTYPHLGLFGQLDALFDSLWQYKEFKGSNSIPVARQCVIGVFSTDFHILDRRNGYEAYLPNTHSYQYINLGDPDKIVFMLQETAVPAFKMKDASVWTTEYNKKKKVTYSFTDKRLEGIDLITPEKLNEEGEIAWAYGWLFGLIASVNGRIQVKPSGAYMSREKRVKGNTGYYDYFKIKSQKSSDLSACHRLFIRDEELFQDIYAQSMTLLDGDKAGQIVRIYHWVNDEEIWQNRGKLRTSMLEDERLVIQNEPQYLAKRFERLSSGTLSISYDVNTLKVKYDDSLGILAQRELEYQQAKAADSSEA